MKLIPKYIKIINDLEILDDPQSIRTYAKHQQLDPYTVKLYKDIFDIYDEAEYECVVYVHTATFYERSKFRYD